jgi:hypothetical protein
MLAGRTSFVVMLQSYRVIMRAWKRSRSMRDSQISRFENRTVEEEKLAREAISSDSALAHQQVAMLYKTELAIFRS